MRATRRLWMGVLASGVFASAGATPLCPPVVRVTFFDSPIPPFINGSGDAFEASPGLMVDWAREAIRQTGCSSTLDLRRRPVRRGYQELERNDTDLLLPATATPANRQIAAFPPGADETGGGLGMIRIAMSLWVRRGDSMLSWNGEVLHGLGPARVGVPAGTVSENLAAQYNWPVVVGVNGATTTAQLVAERFPVALLPDVTAMAQPEALRSRIQRLGPPVRQTWYYGAASRSFAATYPEFMQRYWLALCQVARADPGAQMPRNLQACIAARG